MNTYTTADVAAIIGVHPNTVRMYEAWGLIPRVERKANGYRVFTDFTSISCGWPALLFRLRCFRTASGRKQ